MNPTGKIVFGEWLPDLPELDSSGLVEALNAVPTDGSYTNYLALSTTDDALASRCLGAFAGVDDSGNINIYAGTQTRLYRKNATAWADVSSATYTSASTDYWKFAQFDDLVIATNYADEMQKATIGGATFTNITVSGDAPKARHLAVINRFLVVANTNDTVNGIVPYRVQWSAIDDVTNWPTPGSATAVATQSGEQFLKSALFECTGVFSGDQFGIVSQQRGLVRMTYVGGDIVWQFDTIDDNRGAWFPNASVQVGRSIFFISHDGFYVTDGVTVTPIGDAKVNRFFLGDCDQTYLERVTGAVNFQHQCVFWCYPSFSATSGTPNRIIIYNWAEGRWSHAEDTMQLLFSSLSTGYTLDGLDNIINNLDAFGLSLDSSVWQGGQPTIMGFDSNRKLGSLSGDPKDATFETGEIGFNAGDFFHVNEIRPLINGSPTAITASIGKRLTQDNAGRSYTSDRARNSRSGTCNFREEVRFGTVRLKTSGSFDKAIGLYWDGVPSSRL